MWNFAFEKLWVTSEFNFSETSPELDEGEHDSLVLLKFIAIIL